MRRLLILVIFSLVQSAYSQVDSISLPEIEIIFSSIRQNQIKSNDSSVINFIPKNNLANQLYLTSEIYLRNYGGSGLNSNSIRGGSNNQTLILWNDVPINSPLLGSYDLGILNAASDVKITKGSESSMWGSGAVAGVINMNTNMDKIYNLNFFNHFTLSSFNGFRNEFSFNHSFSKFNLSLQYIHNQAENNYPINIGDLSYKNSNSSFNQNQYLSSLSYNIKNIKLDFKHWSTNHYREIPPLITQLESTTNQKDISNRNLLSFQLFSKSSKLKITNAYFWEKQNYKDPLNKLDEIYQYKSYINDATYEMYSNKFTYLFGGNYYHTNGISSSFDSLIYDNRYAVFSKIQYSKNRIELEASLRKEFYKTTQIPYIPAIKATYKFNKMFLMATINRAFRLPTLNDLYWSPGGNSSLKPESGWAQEIQFNYQSGVEVQLNLYRRKIINWIQWGRKPNEFLFSALNLTEVISKGLEFQLCHKTKVNSIEIFSKLNYNYTLSQNQVEIKIPSIKKGQQLWYVPIHHLGINVQLVYKKLAFQYNHQFFSESYGINENLLPYNIANAYFKYKIARSRNEVEFYISINNIGNKNTFVIERRPNPGINYQIGIILNFNKT